MAQFDIEIKPPAFPVKSDSSSRDIVRLQEWLVVRGLNVGTDPGADPRTARAAGIDGEFGNGTQGACNAFAAANGLANGTVDAAFWQKLTGGMEAAFKFRSTKPNVGDAIVETAQIHFDQKPLEARQKVGGGFVGLDNSGPWVRAYCLGHSAEWCQGAASQWVKQAFAALGRQVPIALDEPAVDFPLFVPSIVKAARNASRLVTGGSATAVPAGSFFFVKGQPGGPHSHTHVGVTASPIRDNGTFDSIEGNTNAGGSSAGVEVCKRTSRTRASCDFGILV
jgi:peptidoglycan hydrolase-like protein with peptidoglycan-binding domain